MTKLGLCCCLGNLAMWLELVGKPPYGMRIEF